MWYNFLFVNVYFLVVRLLKEYEDLQSVDVNGVELDYEYKVELYWELESLRLKLYARLDQYVKQQIQKRGITVISNNYCGFDMEYKVEDLNAFNTRLISVQTANQNRTIIKIPLYHEFDISYIHPLSS
jgi:hypothetical protein